MCHFLLAALLVTAAFAVARANCIGYGLRSAAAELLPVVADAELVRLQLPVAHLPQEAQDRQHRQACVARYPQSFHFNCV